MLLTHRHPDERHRRRHHQLQLHAAGLVIGLLLSTLVVWIVWRRGVVRRVGN